MQPLVAEYDNMLRCIRCAACLTSCATYVVTHKEEEGPRGRIAIMRALVEGHLDITPDGVTHLDNCLLCEACTNVCPAGVQMESMGIAFRETMSARRANARKPLAARFAFEWLFGDLGHFRLLGRLLWLYQRSGVQWLARHTGVLRLLGLHAMESMLPGVPSSFVVPDGQSVGQGPPVQVFAGCIMSTAFAPTTRATARLVAAFGGRAELTSGQVCCGALQAHSGELERARAGTPEHGRVWREPRAHRGQRGRLRGDVEALRSALAGRPPRRGPGPASARRKRVPGRAPAAPTSARATAVGDVADACHLLHAQRISEAPRKLLRSIPGLELREMAEPEICCGSAGIYNVSHPTMSAQLQQRKCANIAASGSEEVVTGNPGCLVQLQAGLPDGIRARHIVDVLADAYAPES